MHLMCLQLMSKGLKDCRVFDGDAAKCRNMIAAFCRTVTKSRSRKFIRGVKLGCDSVILLDRQRK